MKVCWNSGTLFLSHDKSCITASWRNENKVNLQIRSPPSPLLPRIIMDESPSTVHSADLFFSTSSTLTRNRPTSRRSYSTGKPRSPSNLNRSRTSPSQSQPNSFVPPPPPPPLKIGTQVNPECPEDQTDLRTVMQLSKSESERQALFLDKLSSQEEDDLSRALAESLRMDEKSHSLSSPGAGPSRPPVVPVHTRPHSQSLPSPLRPSSESTRPLVEAVAVANRRSKSPEIEIGYYPEPLMRSSPPHNSVSLLDDEALARQLAAEEEREDERWRESARLSGENLQPSVEDDEAFARQLALEEEEEDKHETPATVPTLPPAYADAVSPPASVTNASLSRSHSSASSESLPARSLQPMRSNSDEAFANEKSRHSVPSAPLPSLKEQLEVEDNMGSINVNQFVDRELLRGVCESQFLVVVAGHLISRLVAIGFYDPVVQDQAQAMAGVMPNIISLPYGKSPPLHLQTTSWRHLLKLMARLSGTRIEPTAQATQRNEDLHLRTVIQFVRVSVQHVSHHSAGIQ